MNAPANGTYASQGEFKIDEDGLADGTFTGYIAPLEADAYKWAAVYPYNEDNTDIAALKLNFGAAEVALATAPALAGENCPLFGASAEIAKEENVALTVKQLASAIALTVKNDTGAEYPVNEISLTFPTAVAGAFTVNASDPDAITYEAADGALQTITLKASEAVKIAADECATFYAPIAPVTIAGGSKIVCSVNGLPSEIAVSADIVFKAGKVKPISVKTPKPIYTLPEGKIYAGKAATFKANKAAYPEIANVKWTVNGVTVEGDEADLVLDTAQSRADALDGKAMPKAKVAVSAEIGGKAVTTEFEVELEVFWMVQEIATWGRNCTPVFNKECTKAYYQTRDGAANGRKLVQIDLVNRTVKEIDLKMDKASIKTDNGGQFSVNPTNGDIICCNNQAIYCIAEADLSKKWQFDVPGTSATSSASVMTGCGPAFNNDCSVIFVGCTNNYFYALNAATGEKISEYNFGAVPSHRNPDTNYSGGMGKVQFGVWGANRIIMHRNKNSMSVHWITLNSNGLELEAEDAKESNSHASETADITSPVIDEAAGFAYFTHEGTITKVPLDGYDDAKHINGTGGLGTGLNFSGCLCNGYLYTASAVKALNRIELASGTSTNNLFTETIANNIRNFDATTADENGNIYFTLRIDGQGLLLMRGKTTADGGFDYECIGKCSLSGGNYQGAQNVGGNYMIACCRAANGNPTIYVRCIGAKRAKGWSGYGGDPCNTKNATIANAQ